MTPETFSRRQQRIVLRMVGERTGLAFNEDRLPAAAAAIARVARRREVGDGGRFLELLSVDEQVFDELVAELTVGETYFFREPEQFAFVREHVLPELRRRLGPNRIARMWSAGCASGEEAYSLAIACDEEGLGGRSEILATDISREALAKARRGVYREWSLRGVAPEIVRQYWRRDGENYLLEERIVRRVEFRFLNLAEAPSWRVEGSFDLIFCRNVLIYFDAATVAAVARRLFAALAPGGWLVTASSDPPIADAAPFETVVAPSAIAFRRPLGGRGEWSATVRAERSTDGAATAERATPSETPPAWDTSPAVPGTPPRAFPTGLATPTQANEAADPLAETAACAARVRELSNRDFFEAARLCEASTARHPLSAELHYLQAVLLVQLDRHEEAARAVRRAIYLDRSLAVAHFTLGTILERCGDAAGACRAYRNARELAATFPASEVLPLSDGERADRLTEAADRRLQALDWLRPRVER